PVRRPDVQVADAGDRVPEHTGELPDLPVLVDYLEPLLVLCHPVTLPTSGTWFVLWITPPNGGSRSGIRPTTECADPGELWTTRADLWTEATPSRAVHRIPTGPPARVHRKGSEVHSNTPSGCG